jgi:hypothetical protein
LLPKPGTRAAQSEAGRRRKLTANATGLSALEAATGETVPEHLSGKSERRANEDVKVPRPTLTAGAFAAV